MAQALSVPECLTLRDQLGPLPCERSCIAGLFPSYFEKGSPKGCWLAHTTLSLLEVLRIKEALLHSHKRLSLEDVLLATLLHDIGKLTKDYLLEAYPYHNLLSAIIALKSLKSADIPVVDPLIIARAIFLHHEYRHWRSVFQAGYLNVHIIDSIKKRKLRVIMAEDFEEPLEYLKEIIREELRLRGALSPVLNNLIMQKGYRAKPEDYQKIASISGGWSMVPKFLSLYWILQLVDNRAASAREGANAYWAYRLARYKELSDKPCALARAILDNDKDPQVLLTLIRPRKLREEASRDDEL